MTNTLTEAEMTKVQDIVMEQLEVKRDQLLPEARIVEDLGADSLDVMEISMKLEETFGFTIDDEKLERIKSMDELYEAVGNLLRPE
jgi:acyl carrier protein